MSYLLFNILVVIVILYSDVWFGDKIDIKGREKKKIKLRVILGKEYKRIFFVRSWEKNRNLI